MAKKVFTQQQVLDYLHGAAALDGVWYGDDAADPSRKPYWWRAHLAKVAPSAGNPLERADSIMLKAVFKQAILNGSFSITEDKVNGGYLVKSGAFEGKSKSITAAIDHLLENAK